MNLAKRQYRTGQHALTAKDWQRLLEVIDSVEDEALLRLAVTTGIRREDIVRLKIADLDFENAKVVFYEAKKKRIHTAWLQASVISALRKYLKTIPKRERLFSFSGRTAYNKLNRLCDRAGIARRPFHAMRATCIKFRQQAGWEIEAAAALIGDSVRVVQEHYATPSDDELRQNATDRPTI